MSDKPEIGKIGRVDLTIENATEVRDFYAAVVGWESTDHDMGEYADYSVSPAGGSDPVAGICHRLGPNENIPSQWLVYINVADLDESIKQTESLGGKVVTPPRDMGGYGGMCVIEDPAGAVCALMEPPK